MVLLGPLTEWRSGSTMSVWYEQGIALALPHWWSSLAVDDVAARVEPDLATSSHLLG